MRSRNVKSGHDGRIMLRMGLILAGCVFLMGGLLSQEMPTFKVDVKVVNLLATVRDKHGQIISNLTKDDFRFEEDGRPQTIKYFTRETDLPLTLGLLVDTSMSQRRVLEQERSASYAFLDRVLRPDRDKAFIIHFDQQVELLQDLTSSKLKLQEALELVETPQEERRGGGGGGYPGGGYPGGGYPGGRGGGRRGGGGGGGRGPAGTLLYDGVFLASDEMMRPQQGRKAVIVLTDGVDQGSKLTLFNAIESAQRSDTLVYGILFTDEDAYGFGGGFPGLGGMGRRGGGRFPQQERPDGKKVLEQMAKETGGRMFEVSRKHPIEEIYAQIQEELRNQYNLGYTPDRAEGAAAGGYHKIHLTTKQRDLIVQTREGYYSTQ